MNLVRTINWIITYRCNSRCIHCDIWRLKSDLTMSISNIKRVLNDSLIEESYKYYGSKFDISIGGGEPFSVDNLQEILETIEDKFPGSFKSITTNGLYNKRIIEFVKRNRRLNFKINISIDGINKVHDRIRGIKGAFDKTMETILNIKKINPYQKIELKFTFIPQNYDHIVKVYRLAEKLKCNFTFKPAENIESYTNKISNINLKFTREQLCSIRNQAFYISDEMYKKGDFLKAKFFRDIPFYLFSKKKPERCSVLDNDITIMPNGKIHTCLMSLSKGNINEEKLEKFWRKRTINFKKCLSCMLMCGSYKDYSNKYYERKVANIETTVRCNLDCEMCTQRELRKKNSRDMSIDVFKKIINNHSDVTHVSFVGGEPFLNKEFFAMMNFLDGKGITFEITTNGTLMNANMIDKLEQCAGLRKINFSLDGMQKYHDSERGRGVFKKCIKALQSSSDFFNVCVCTVLKKDNLPEILNLTHYLEKLGIRNQKVIYGVSFSKSLRQRSKTMMASLRIQGPYFKEYLKDYGKTIKIFNELENTAKRNKINIYFEPLVIKKLPMQFFSELIPENIATCRQIFQYRFNSMGERIICEFIRNKYDLKMIGYLKTKLLPICKKCCKLELEMNSKFQS